MFSIHNNILYLVPLFKVFVLYIYKPSRKLTMHAIVLLVMLLLLYVQIKSLQETNKYPLGFTCGVLKDNKSLPRIHVETST